MYHFRNTLAHPNHRYMHKVFINNKPLIFDNVYGDLKSTNSNLLILSDSSFTLDDVLMRIETENIPGIIYLSVTPDLTWTDFTSRFVIVEAAGGLVRNEKGEVLAIYRKKFWDLPKGKLDFNESPESAAVREVKEECGLKDIEMNSFLMKTFHIYTEKRKNILKKTHWFTMTSDSSQLLNPQEEEDIEKVEWMNKDKIIKLFYPKTYHSIAEVLDKYFSMQ